MWQSDGNLEITIPVLLLEEVHLASAEKRWVEFSPGPTGPPSKDRFDNWNQLRVKVLLNFSLRETPKTVPFFIFNEKKMPENALTE